MLWNVTSISTTSTIERRRIRWGAVIPSVKDALCILTYPACGSGPIHSLGYLAGCGQIHSLLVFYIVILSRSSMTWRGVFRRSLCVRLKFYDLSMLRWWCTAAATIAGWLSWTTEGDEARVQEHHPVAISFRGFSRRLSSSQALVKVYAIIFHRNCPAFMNNQAVSGTSRGIADQTKAWFARNI